MTADRAFNTGKKYVRSQMSSVPDSATEEQRVFGEWPTWCEKMKTVLEGKSGEFETPELNRWYRDGDREYFEVTLHGQFNHANVPPAMSSWLASSRGAEGHVFARTSNAGLTVALNHHQLPDMLEFEPDKIPTSDDEVYLGELSEGSDLVWDTRTQANGLSVGKNGSGKSETVATILMQLHLKGWELIIATPTRNDTTYKMFEKLGHTVVYGANDDDLTRLAEIVQGQNAEFDRREEERGNFEEDWWGDGDHEWQGRKVMLVFEECGEYVFPQKKTDSEIAFQAKSFLQVSLEKRVRRGRKVRLHSLLVTQTPYVDHVGGGYTLSQIGFAVAHRSLPVTFQAIVFPVIEKGSEGNPAISRVLSDPQTPPGRGVARGGLPPEGAFSVVDDTPMQLAYCPREQREELTGLREPVIEVGETPDPTDEVDQLNRLFEMSGPPVVTVRVEPMLSLRHQLLASLGVVFVGSILTGIMLALASVS